MVLVLAFRYTRVTGVPGEATVRDTSTFCAIGDTLGSLLAGRFSSVFLVLAL